MNDDFTVILFIGAWIVWSFGVALLVLGGSLLLVRLVDEVKRK